MNSGRKKLLQKKNERTKYELKLFVMVHDKSCFNIFSRELYGFVGHSST